MALMQVRWNCCRSTEPTLESTSVLFHKLFHEIQGYHRDWRYWVRESVFHFRIPCFMKCTVLKGERPGKREGSAFAFRRVSILSPSWETRGLIGWEVRWSTVCWKKKFFPFPLISHSSFIPQATKPPSLHLSFDLPTSFLSLGSSLSSIPCPASSVKISMCLQVWDHSSDFPLFLIDGQNFLIPQSSWFRIFNSPKNDYP